MIRCGWFSRLALCASLLWSVESVRAQPERQPGNPDVDSLLRVISGKDPCASGEAAEALSRIGESAVPGLIRLLGSGDAGARFTASIALGKMGRVGSPAVAALTGALADTSAEVRWGAAMALAACGPEGRTAIPQLLRTLSDADQDVRWGASLAIDSIDPQRLEENLDWRSVAAIIDTLTPLLMRETHVPGVSVALISGRRLIWNREFGVANKGSGERVTDTTLFEACSMTKPVFAVLVMRLVEEGKLDLDRPLVDYLDLSSLRAQPGRRLITARMVLSHTSGLPNWRKGEEERDGPLPVLFAPGSKFGYSGEGFYYLQRVVERITGEPLDLLARRMLFDPLGLRHTSFVWTNGLDSRIAGGHDAAGDFLQKSRYIHPNAAYSLFVSASDYARFFCAVMNPGQAERPVLTQRSVDMMLSHQVAVMSREPIERPGTARGTEVYWGLGWSINTTGQGEILHHSGANRSGFRCFHQYSPSRGTGIVIMTNGAGGSDLWPRLINRIGNF